ncbi:MAG: hypothetical protein MR739_12495 [Spirochaetia bacterium]|nr:hypothetical protein [Spirochaetia bacterium]
MNLHFLGWLFASQKTGYSEFRFAPAASLASLSPVAAFGAPTILATVCKSNTRN